MSAKVVEPEKGKEAFTCPRCGAFAKFDWLQLGAFGIGGGVSPILHAAARCHHCDVLTLWAAEAVQRSAPIARGGQAVSVRYQYQLVYPAKITAPYPHPDLPEECAPDYAEAMRVLDLSPRASAALLRLVTEKLCQKICEDTAAGSSAGKSLNDMIGLMVANGLPVTIQRALDSLRVIGNESVHPGTMDIQDDRTIALRLFSLVEIVVENRITEPRKVAELYGQLPSAKVEGIEKRDK